MLRENGLRSESSKAKMEDESFLALDHGRVVDRADDHMDDRHLLLVAQRLVDDERGAGIETVDKPLRDVGHVQSNVETRTRIPTTAATAADVSIFVEIVFEENSFPRPLEISELKDSRVVGGQVFFWIPLAGAETL